MVKTKEEKHIARLECVDEKFEAVSRVVEDIKQVEETATQIKYFRTYVRIGILIVVGKTTPHRFSDVQMIGSYIPFPEIIYAIAPMDLIKMYVKMKRSLDFTKGKIKIIGGFSYKLFGSIDGEHYDRIAYKTERNLGFKFLKSADESLSPKHVKR